MPDIGSSQNLQAVEVPAVNGSAAQNGGKSPSQEVGKMLDQFLHACIVLKFADGNFVEL